jgi:ABC-type nitrate/sulfonate/bicarbonate transport system substrate-binding protein
MRRNLLLTLVLAVAATLSSALSAQPAEKVSLAAAFGTIWTAVQPAFCKQRGEFAKADLGVEIVTTRGGSETVQAVTTGAVDVGYGTGI